MKTIFRITVAVSALAAAGCNTLPEGSLGKTFAAESYLNTEIPGGDFNAALAREYQKLAAFNANVEVNWIDTTAYIERSKMAAMGNVPELYSPAQFGLGGELENLRGATMARVEELKGTDPQKAAECYASYDFLVESTWQSPGQDADYARSQYESACGMSEMVVYFGFGSARVTSAGEEVVQGVVNMISGTSKLVSLVGHTDTVGSIASNQRLSERRANNVKASFVNKGVSADNITTAGRGEQELAVQTGDGVREQLNRRVEIDLAD